MSVVTTKDVFCDRCTEWVGGGTEISKREARRIALACGWVRRFSSGKRGVLQDLCPECWAKDPRHPNRKPLPDEA